MSFKAVKTWRSFVLHSWITHTWYTQVLAHLFSGPESPLPGHPRMNQTWLKIAFQNTRSSRGMGQKSRRACPCPWSPFPTFVHSRPQCLTHSRSSAFQRTASTSWPACWQMNQLGDDELLMLNYLAPCQKCGVVPQRSLFPSLFPFPHPECCQEKGRDNQARAFPEPAAFCLSAAKVKG